MKKNDAFRRAAALMAALSITVSLAAPAFAATYYIDNGDITITKNADGKQTVQQGSNEAVKIGDDEEIIITTQESAEEPEGADQPENTDRQEGADQPESAEEPKSADQPESADQQVQPQQAAPAPAAAPAAPTSVNGKENGVFGNIITVINNAATALKLTLKDVKIDVHDTGKYDRWDGEKGEAALSVQGEGDVEIELDGKNELKSGVLRAGLEKTSTGTLTLKDDNQKAGSLTATGNYNGAGIGGGTTGSGSNVTVSGAAQVTTIAGKSYGSYGAGATIGNGGNRTEAEYGFTCIDGKEIQADISGVTTGYIHHIIYEQDGTTIKREWWEPVRPQPNPEDPNAPTEESNEVDLGAPGLHVETLEGDPCLLTPSSRAAPCG